MCGITGVYAKNMVGQMHMIQLSKATEAIASRGPDHQGFYTGEYVGLGHRRLSIIDTSYHANQPFSDNEERYHLIYNGEIYNYKELRKELLADGIEFITESDTEVLLQLFIKYGKQCLHKLNGFFAFAIYDKKDDSLFIARDRFGIKPLLYFNDENKFLFASEIKSLFEYNIPKEINHEALHYYFQLNYIPAPLSIIQNVHKLEPGHFLCIKNGEFKIEPYYQKEQLLTKKTKLNYSSAQEKLKTLLFESIENRLEADVPVGTFLSGGIDSSVITSIAKQVKNDIRSFSIGYKDNPFYDETKYALDVAKKNNIDHHVFSISTNELLDSYDDILNHFDEPFADSSSIAVHILSKLTKKEVTVALSGDGADELFSGYHKHSADYRIRNKGFSEKMVMANRQLWNFLPQSRSNAFGNRIRQFSKFAELGKLSAKDRYWRLATIGDENHVTSLLKQSKIDSTLKSSFLGAINDSSSINEFLYTDSTLVLPNDMLHKVDSMSMANGLEVRVPFLDHNIVEFAFSLPENFKINSKIKKKILQETFKDLLPDSLFNRPKHGFEVPVQQWLTRELKEKVSELILNRDFIEQQSIFNFDTLISLNKKLNSSNPGDSAAQMWAVFCFQWWWKRFFE